MYSIKSSIYQTQSSNQIDSLLTKTSLVNMVGFNWYDVQISSTTLLHTVLTSAKLIWMEAWSLAEIILLLAELKYKLWCQLLNLDDWYDNSNLHVIQSWPGSWHTIVFFIHVLTILVKY